MLRIRLVALVFALAMSSSVLQAAERDGAADPQWPNVSVDGPQWPNLQNDDAGQAPPLNRRPSFLDPDAVTAYIMAVGSDDALNSGKSDDAKSGAGKPDTMPDTTGSTARWPTFAQEEPPSPFAFETGARYWFSGGSMRFAFSNGNPFFGTPTSTLEWRGLLAHSGEVFARLDHRPTGVFVKGVLGLGTVVDGHMDDGDFLSGQARFSSTTSDVKDGNLNFAMIDVGWAFSPMPGISVGVFAGYHYWNEKVTAYGLFCNQAAPAFGCPSTGAVAVGFNTAVMSYEPTWHAVRLGGEGKVAIDDRWSINGEVAIVPYAVLQNKDSHLLRQSPSDLGPAPNVITDTNYGFGVETEVFLNYAVTPNIEVGGGVRYWGLMSRSGDVHFGPSFATADQLDRFDQQRYGVLLHVKGKF